MPSKIHNFLIYLALSSLVFLGCGFRVISPSDAVLDLVDDRGNANSEHSNSRPSQNNSPNSNSSSYGSATGTTTFGATGGSTIGATGAPPSNGLGY